MKNLIISSLLATSLTFTACQQEPEAENKPTPPMMDMDHSMMEMDHSMMVQNDEEFLAMMIPHHQEAIDTAKVILAKSENADLKELAQAIVDAQTSEIAQMEEWGSEWFGTSFAASDQYEAMMPDLTKLEGEALDQAFIEGMIAHHEMAVMMAEQLKSFTERPELLEMADAIITAQTAEIEMMKGWLK